MSQTTVSALPPLTCISAASRLQAQNALHFVLSQTEQQQHWEQQTRLLDCTQCTAKPRHTKALRNRVPCFRHMHDQGQQKPRWECAGECPSTHHTGGVTALLC